jgi:Na+/H+-dicarboxylate symporter
MILCVLGAIGTAPVPGASIFLLAGILGSMGLPVDAVAIILAVDRILDMARTFTNITGDVFSAVIVDRLDDTLNEDVYNSK